MRKLPPDEQVFNLRQGGMTAQAIAERFNVQRDMVYQAIRRHKGLQIAPDQLKSPYADGTFNSPKSQPVEHRDTGENVGAFQPVDTYRIRHTSLRECGDLLREWGVGRSMA